MVQREESRQRILAAARMLFSLWGYPASSTREIAKQAGLSAKTLFRHFNSKAMFFAAAILVHLREFIDPQLDDRPPAPRRVAHIDTARAQRLDRCRLRLR